MQTTPDNTNFLFLVFHVAPLQCWGMYTKDQNINLETETINFEAAQNRERTKWKVSIVRSWRHANLAGRPTTIASLCKSMPSHRQFHATNSRQTVQAPLSPKTQVTAYGQSLPSRRFLGSSVTGTAKSSPSTCLDLPASSHRVSPPPPRFPRQRNQQATCHKSNP
jgi:hypothetical protein